MLALAAGSCAAALCQPLQAGVVNLNASQTYIQPTTGTTNPGATANGNGSTSDWSFSTSATSAVWSDGLNDNPGASGNYNNASGGTTNASSNDYFVTGTPATPMSLNSPYLALGATTVFYGHSLNMTYGALNLNTIYDASGASTNTYNFSALAFNNSSVYFNDYYGSLTKVLNGPISLSGSNTFNSSRGSYTEAETINGSLSGSGTLTFVFSGGSSRTVTIAGTASTYTGAVVLGTTAGSSTFALNKTLGTVSTYTVGTSWTLADGGSGLINGSAMAVTGAVTLAGATESFGALTGAGTVSSSTTTALTLNGAGTFTGTLSGSSLSVTKAGTGNQILSGTASYGGTTTISAGTLTLGNLFTGSGAVSLNGGTLASGTATTIAGTVTAGSSAATLAPGGIGSVGTLSLGGLTTTNATTINFDLGTGTGTISNGDLINLSGTPTFAAGTILAFNNSASTVTGNDYRLFEGSVSSIDPTAFTIASTAPGGQLYSISSTVDPGYIDLVVGSSQNTLFWNNTGGTGDGLTWDSSMQNWNNGSAPTTFNSSNHDFVTFNDTNNGHYNVTIPGTVTPGEVTVAASGTYNFSGAGGIGGNAGLNLSGPGVLNLATANSFNGSTNVMGGTLNLQNSLAVQNSTVNLAGGAITFDAAVTANAFTFGALSGSTNLSLINTASSPITLTTGGNNASTGYSGSISGSGSLIKTGSGTLTLSGSSTYTGSTNLAGGVLNVGSGENAGVYGPLGVGGTIIFSGGTLQYSSSNQFDYSSRIATTANQPISIDTNGQTVSFATGLTGTGTTLTKLGAGTLALAASNTYTGGTNISGGTLLLAAPGVLPVSSTATFTGTATLDTDGTNPTLASLVVAKGVTGTVANGTLNTNLVVFSASTAATSTLSGGTINMSGGIIDATAAGGTASPSGLTDIVASQITATGGLTVKALGNVTDSGGGNTGFVQLSNTSNIITGGIAVTQGLLNVVNGDGVLGNANDPTTNAVTLSAGAGLIATASVTLNTASIVLSGTGNHYLRVYGSSTMTLAGAISDNGAGATLYKTDLGTVGLYGTDTYTGITEVQNGVLNIYGNESAATGGFIIGQGSAVASTVNFESGSSEAVAVGKAINIGTLPGQSAVSYANQTLNVYNSVTSAGSLSVGRTGFFNVASGATWNQSGSFSIQPVAGSGYSAYVDVAAGGVFNYTGSTVINMTPSISNGGYAYLNISGGTFTTTAGFNNSANISSAAPNNSGGGAQIFLLNGGTITLENNITQLTSTVGNAFTVSLGNGSGGFINTNGFNTAVGATFNNGAGAGMLTIDGGGSVLLTAQNTFTGGANVYGATALIGVSNVSMTSGALGPANGTIASNIVLGSPSVTTSSNLLINGAYNFSNGIYANASGGLVTIGGATDSNAAFTGFITLYNNLTVTQAANAGTNALTLSGQIYSNVVGPAETVTFAGPGNVNVTGTIYDGNAGNLTSTSVAVTGGTVTLSGTNTYSGVTNVSGGHLVLTAASAMSPSSALNISSNALVTLSAHNGSTPIVAQAAGLNISNAAQLDITNNDFIFQNASSGGLTAITALVKAGFNGGTWNGTGGIISSTAAADPSHLTAVGTLLNTDAYSNQIYGSFDSGINPHAADVIVKYTYYGDANLDGAVDGSDYTLIDNGYNNGLTGWQNGDFNYDGVIDGSDYTLIDNAFNTQGATLGVNPATLLAASTAQIAGGSAVPEPASLCLLTLAAGASLRLRRRE